MSADTVGGVWTYAMSLARALQPHGVEVVLAAMGKHLTREQLDQVDRMPNLQVISSDYALEWMEDPWDSVDAAGQWLACLADAIRPDLIHFNHYAHASFEWECPILVVCHSCVLTWWQAVHQTLPPDTFDRYRDVVSNGLIAADEVVAPTAALASAMQRAYGLSATPGVIYNGSDFEPPCRRGVSERSPTIFTAGRLWDEAKNLSALVRAAPDLPWSIDVAGPRQTPTHNADTNTASDETSTESGGATGEAGFPPNMTILGQLTHDEIAERMSICGIYCLPARYEPFGLSILEAARCGAPLVLGDIPTLRELWDGAATFIDPDDVRGLRIALLELIEKPEQREQRSRAARERADRYTLNRMGRAYHKLYLALLQNRTRRADSTRTDLDAIRRRPIGDPEIERIRADPERKRNA
ncbi:MAG: glycosyltransferase family 4 protein [Planctomycetota bacterium]